MEITVQAGDTLGHIALRHLGDASRWRDIYSLNVEAITKEQQRFAARRQMRGPDWIFPGLKLELPA
jgi:nucleoid-associated protein YgaU